MYQEKYYRHIVNRIYRTNIGDVLIGCTGRNHFIDLMVSNRVSQEKRKEFLLT